MGLAVNQARAGRVLLALTLVAGLSACEKFDMPKFGTGAKAEAASPAQSNASVKLVERDVEAPDVFQITDSALWDGRPSLGGVWVAYPGDIQPERVIIRNTENQKFVIGALFKRERENPGPKVQLSSDAAAALGILAGKPTELNVTALRRESVPATVSAKPAPKPAVKKPATKTAAKTVAAKKPTAAKTPPKKAKKSGKLSVNDIASAAINKADAKKKPAHKPVKNTSVTASKIAKPSKLLPVGSLSKPFIQIGIFNVETNARNTATSLSTKGIIPIVKAQQSKGKKFWRVLVGPADSKGVRAALLKKARALGFTDAYFVTN
ncbi:MAG: SPOR domain-containing protein [Alphaproteobacteria bacterium]|nr:SPOR domain-containing protein [Alphaproteobacteria bacterium]